MQAFQLFILESQAARRRLRKIFELPDDCRSHLEHNGVVQSREERPTSFPRPWKRSSRINRKRVFAATAVIGIAAIGTLSYAGKEENETEQKVAITQLPAAVEENDKPLVFVAILKDQASCPEVNTAELQTALEKASAVVLDARPYDEYAVSHIPGARTVPGKPGTTPALYVADVNAILSTIAGYRNVRRYQLGAPAWRALGGVMQVEKQALVRLLAQDATAVLIDARDNAGLTPKLRNAVNRDGVWTYSVPRGR